MSQSTPSSSSHGHPKMQDRRLSVIQDTAIDDLYDIDTHALDKTSPPPHHESSLMSYMESHSPNDESYHQCTSKSPLMSCKNCVGVGEETKMLIKERRVKRGGKAAIVGKWSVLWGFC